MRFFARLLFSLARRPASRWVIGPVFAHFSFILPVKRLVDTKTVIAFYHPRPSYPVHILLVPKRAIASLETLKSQDQPVLLDLLQCGQRLIIDLNLEEAGTRLIMNAGKYQEAPQLHMHLVAESLKPHQSSNAESKNEISTFKRTANS